MMKTAPINTQNNSDIKRAVIAFQQPQARQLERRQYRTYKLRTAPADPTSLIYKLSVLFLKMGHHSKSGSSSSAGCKQYSRDRTSHRDPQATQLRRRFSRAMHLPFLSKQKSTTSKCPPRRLDRPRSTIRVEIFFILCGL
eukprot:2037280-Ditylum_brightwellii.AAC.1